MTAGPSDARRWIAAARSLVVLTGAGVSAESGIPTFRDAGGLWRNFSFQDLASPEGFARDPKLVWEWYDWRRSQIAATEPNDGHHAIAARTGVTLVTQNVDGLHARAGSRGVLELHGNIWQMRCTVCPRSWRDDSPRLAKVPPRCECGALARPGVVWFGESLPYGVLETAAAAARQCEVLLVAGTSAQVYPAAGLIPLARSQGARVIEVNPDETAASSLCDALIREPSAVALPFLLGPGESR